MRIKFLLSAVLLSAVFLLSGCKGVPISFQLNKHPVVSVEGKTLSEAETRLIALQYKEQYDRYYAGLLGTDFWKKEVQEGMSFQQFVKDYEVFEECKVLLILSLYGEEKDAYIHGDDEARLAAFARETYAGFTADDKAFTGATEQDLLSVLRLYFNASMIIDELMNGKKTEVSDEESRMADISVIRVKDRDAAVSLQEKLGKGENFANLAAAFSVDPVISYTVAKTQLLEPINTLVFSMKEGAVSDVISFDGSYYLIRLDSSFNTILSANNRRNLIAARRFSVWNEPYEQYAKNKTVYRNENLWNGIDLSAEGTYTRDPIFSFFQ